MHSIHNLVNVFSKLVNFYEKSKNVKASADQPVTSWLVALLLFPIFSFAEGQPGDTNLYAYRADGEHVPISFYKLCVGKRGYNVILFWGDRPCPIGCTQDLKWQNWSDMVQMKEEPLENVMRRQKERNDRDILKAFYEPVWRKVIPENGLWEAQDVGVKLFTQGLPRGALSIALPDGLEDWTKAEISRFKVVLQRPDLKTKTYPLIFNSELEYGKLFLFRTVNHQIISYDEKVDPKLDILAMADPKTGARFVLTACETTFGGDKSKSVLQLYLSKPGMKNEGFCFPIQLTKSPNMVRHAMDLYLEGKRIAPSRNLASIEPLAYGEPPFTIKKNIGGSNYHAVVNNADEYLIEFDGDGDIKTDHKDRYLTERARKIPRLIRKPVEVHEYPRDPFAIVPDDSKTKNTEEDPK